MAGSIYALHTSAYGGGAAKNGYMFDKPSLPSGYQDIKLNNLQGQINQLKAKEEAFCAKFGYEDLTSFINDIREIFREFGENAIALQRFSTQNLRKYLKKFQKTNSILLNGERIKISFRTDGKKIDFGEEFKNGLTNSISSGDITWYTSIDSEVQTIELTWDTWQVKNIINKIEGRHFVREKRNINNLIEFINNDAKNLIRIDVVGHGQTVQEYLLKNRTSIFQYSKQEIRDLQKTDPAFLQKINTAIKNFVRNELCAGATADFIQAAEIVWNQKIGNNVGIEFLVGGADSWITNTVGSLGELQTAIFFQYISKKVKSPILSNKISEIIGNKTNFYGQQLHSDIEILKEFGIQVKNYGSDVTREGEKRKITVNLHPSELGSIGASDVASYIANSYFNKSVTPYSEGELEAFFKSHASEMLNLDLDTGVADTVSFYFIGGHLIPGSALITEAYKKETLDVHTNIVSSLHPEYDDAGFNTVEWGAPFHEYWHATTNPPVQGKFISTEKNDVGSYDSKITFKTTFTYSALFDGKYRVI